MMNKVAPVNGTKKQAIMKTALGLFKKYSFHQVGVDTIIEETPVAKNTFYKNYFSKDNLMLSCLEEEITTYKETLKQAVEYANKHEQSPHEYERMLKGFYTWHLQQIRTPKYTGSILLKSSIELSEINNTKVLIKEYQNWKHEYLASILEKCGIKADYKIRILLNIFDAILIPTTQSNLIPDWDDIVKYILTK